MDPFMTFFTTLDPNQVGLASIVTLVILSIIRGWLVPSGAVKERITDKDSQIASLAAERDTWRTAFQTADETRNEQSRQIGELITGISTVTRLIEGLRTNLDRNAPPKTD